MSVFITSEIRNGRVQSFTRAPRVAKAPIGYIIEAFCDDATLYGGNYVKSVGFADDTPRGKKGWRFKRDATKALADAIAFGIVQG